jgi:hypothetical protein
MEGFFHFERVKGSGGRELRRWGSLIHHDMVFVYLAI